MSDAHSIADRTARHLLANDPVAQALGVRLLEASPGRAVVAMTVRPDMCNGLGMGHGGVLFTLADCALELASNSHDRATVAASLSVDFVRACAPDDELVAVCEERHRGKSTGTYDVQITDSSGHTIALLRAHAHEIGGPVVGDP